MWIVYVCETNFICGDDLVKKEIDDEDIENLLIQQIEFCNKIILNKVDELTTEELNKVKAIIRTLQPKAEMIETNYGKVEISKILNTNAFDFDEASMSAGWIEELNRDDNEHEEEGETEEYGIGTFVYFRKKPFDKEKFDKFAVNFPNNVIRSKGLFWFSDEPETMYVFEQSGKQVQAYEVGQWIASCPEEEQKAILAQNSYARENWDETYGDRVIKLVFIGQKMDKEEMIRKLDACLKE